MTGQHPALQLPDPDALLYMDEEEDGGLLLDIRSKSFREAQRAVATISTKASKRSAQQDRIAKANSRLMEELMGTAGVGADGADGGDGGDGGLGGASEGGDDSGEGRDSDADLAQAEEKFRAMKAEVDKALQAGDEQHGWQQAEPEPARWQQALQPVQDPPALELQAVPEVQALLQQQQQLLGLPELPDAGSSSRLQADTFAWLLRQGCEPLHTCPSEAAARLLFDAVCYADRDTATAAYERLAAWCGEPLLAAGAESQGAADGGSCSAACSSSSSSLPAGLSLAEQRPPVTIKWVPGAADVLQALATLGCTAAAARDRGVHSKRGSGRAAVLAPGPEQQQQQQAQPDDAMDEDGPPPPQQHQEKQRQQQLLCRYSHLPLLLRLLVLLCRGHAAGRLDMSGLLAEGRLRELALALMALTMDQAAQAACRCALPDALLALLEVPDAPAWQRLLPGLLEGLLRLGPSHRATVGLLGALPRTSSRCVVLRQWGALQLLAELVPGAAKQVLPGRGAGSNSREAKQQLAGRLLEVLGPKEAVRKLVVQLSAPPSGRSSNSDQGAQLQTWTLLSILDAADLLLWVDISTPGVGVGAAVCGSFLAWLEALDQALKGRKLNNSHVRTRVSMLAAAYEYAKCGSVAPAAAGDAQEDELD